MERARELGLICFSSPFDETAVDFLEDLDVPAYKIASFENNHLPLIARRLLPPASPSSSPPVWLASGRLDDAVHSRDAGCTDLILLKCTSTIRQRPAQASARSASA